MKRQQQESSQVFITWLHCPNYLQISEHLLDSWSLCNCAVSTFNTSHCVHQHYWILCPASQYNLNPAENVYNLWILGRSINAVYAMSIAICGHQWERLAGWLISKGGSHLSLGIESYQERGEDHLCMIKEIKLNSIYPWNRPYWVLKPLPPRS